MKRKYQGDSRWKCRRSVLFLQVPFDAKWREVEQFWRVNSTDSRLDKDIRLAPCSYTAAFVLFSVKKRIIEAREVKESGRKVEWKSQAWRRTLSRCDWLRQFRLQVKDRKREHTIAKSESGWKVFLRNVYSRRSLIDRRSSIIEFVYFSDVFATRIIYHIIIGVFIYFPFDLNEERRIACFLSTRFNAHNASL